MPFDLERCWSDKHESEIMGEMYIREVAGECKGKERRRQPESSHKIPVALP